MAALDKYNRNALFPLGAQASIVAHGYGTDCTVTHVTVTEHLKNGVKVTEADGTVRTFTLSGYERGSSNEWKKPYLHDHAGGLEIESRYATINAAKARDKQRLAHLETMRTAIARKDEPAFKAALTLLNDTERS